MDINLADIVKKHSKNQDYNFNGYLMYKNTEIARIDNTTLSNTFEDNLLPVIMLNKSAGSFEAWLQTRVIDTHRTNSRQVRRRLSVRSEVPKEIVIKARAVSITDNYWLKWDNENISYEEVRSRLSDGLNSIALYGNSTDINFTDIDISPELTNIGSFEKCWKLINNQWHMLKRGSYKENFAEVFVSNVALALGFKAVKYEAIEDGSIVKCKDFTFNAKYDFEPMFSFVQDYWDIDASIEVIEQLGYIEDFLDITFMDALCYNIDRHTFNFGILRMDGVPVSLAPNFDNNLGLSGVLNNSQLESTWYSTSFTQNNYKPILKSYNYKMPFIDFELIEKILQDTLIAFPTIKNEGNFCEVILKIMKSNYDMLLN